MDYPAVWSEFEDGEGSFLFYNPERWTGNFRISAFKGKSKSYGAEVLRGELSRGGSVRPLTVGGWKCAYSVEMFEEEGVFYTCHRWVTGAGDMAFDVSFIVQKGGSKAEAEQVIATLESRRVGERYPAEVIPVRLAEICQINEAYEWVEHEVKERLKTDFQGTEADIAHMQQMIDQAAFSPKKKEVWLNLGIVLCVILANEVDGLEWRTLMDGNREAPILVDVADGKVTDPMKLVWSRVKAGATADLAEAYKAAL